MTEREITQSDKIKSDDKLDCQNEISNTIEIRNKVNKKKHPYLKRILLTIGFVIVVVGIYVSITLLTKKNDSEVHEDKSLDNSNDNSNDDLPDNSNDDLPDNSNDNLPDNSNDNLPDNSNDNPPDNSNDNPPDNSNDNLPDNSNDNLPDKPSDNLPDKPSDNLPDYSFDYSFEEAKEVIDSSTVEENHKLIEESLSNITEYINELDNSNKRLNFEPIISDESSLIIPKVLNDSTDEKSILAKEDIQMYNNKYWELSETINEFSANASQSIKEIQSSLENLKDEIMKKSQEFEETIKEISYPLILVDQISKNKTFSGRQLIDSEEIEEYKSQISELNVLYNMFFLHIKNMAENITQLVKGVPDSVESLYNYIYEGITNYKEMLSKLDINDLHQNLLSLKNSFLKIKIDMEQIKIDIEIRISTLEFLIKNNKEEFGEFQKNYDEVYNKLEERGNDIIKKVSEEYKVNIPNINASRFIADSILNSITFTYEIIIKVLIIINNQIVEVSIVINVEVRTSLDLLFIMDLTGSMGPYLQQAKNNLIDIMDRIIDQCPGIDINLGFIGYRDIIQEGGGEYMNIEFTKNHNEIRDKIRNVYADRGGDMPEDVAWAFERALEKNWKSNAKFIVFVADAPGHGLKYTDMDKKYPNGIVGRKDIEESVRELASNNILMFCLKISSQTNKMFNIFQNVYNNYGDNKLQIVNQYNSGQNLPDEVVKSAISAYKTQRNGINLEKAVEYLITNTKSESTRQCAKYVADALEKGGFKFTRQKSAYMYHSNGILKTIGFSEIDNPSSHQKGDITVTENNDEHEDGHIAMWCGTNWISDFVQNSEFVYKNNQPKVHYYRFTGI